MFQMMNEARLFVGLQGLAGAGAACHNAVSYANERLQGPSPMNPGEKAKIVEHPDVRRMLMQMRSVTEGLRAMMYTVAWYTDMAHHGPEKPGNITRISSTYIFLSARLLERIRDLRLPVPGSGSWRSRIHPGFSFGTECQGSENRFHL